MLCTLYVLPRYPIFLFEATVRRGVFLYHSQAIGLKYNIINIIKKQFKCLCMCNSSISSMNKKDRMFMFIYKTFASCSLYFLCNFLSSKSFMVKRIAWTEISVDQHGFQISWSVSCLLCTVDSMLTYGEFCLLLLMLDSSHADSRSTVHIIKAHAEIGTVLSTSTVLIIVVLDELCVHCMAVIPICIASPQLSGLSLIPCTYLPASSTFLQA